MKQKVPVFIISGKSPLGDPGGYPAYAHTLSHVLYELGYDTHTIAISKKRATEKTNYGEIHFLTTRLLQIFPVLNHLALAALPYYGLIFALEIRKIMINENMKSCIVWGMGPWAFPGIVLKRILPKDKKIILFASYFTSTRHEMKGALDAIRIKDYGFIPKIKYFLVYHLVARVFQVFEYFSLKSCNAVVIHYKSSENIIKKYFNVSGKHVHNFPWYNEIFKREVSKNSGTIEHFKHPLIVSICRQDPRKGINFIIRAIGRVAKEIPEVSGLIVGSGSFLKLNQKLVKKLGLSRNIQVVGFVPDIDPVLKNADIAVIVPLAQGSSALTVLEAMSYGKAIIGSDCDGIPEDISDKKSGLIVKKGNEEELAEAMLTLLKNNNLRKVLGANAYKSYKNRFGFNNMKENIRKVINQYTKQLS